MLVLSRRIGEELIVNGNIRVRIESIQGGKVRVGISAPPDVTVDRSEVHERRGQFQDNAADPPLASAGK